MPPSCIESLCRRVLVLNDGKIFFDGALASLRQKISPERLLIIDLINPNESIAIPKAKFIRQEGHRVWLSFNPTEIASTDLISHITAKHAISDLTIENLSIEEIIARFYRNSQR